MNLNETTNLADYRTAGGDPYSSENRRILSKLVEREVMHCISQTVAYVLEKCQNVDYSKDRGHDIDQDDVMELCGGRDYEEAGEDHVRNMSHDQLVDFLNGCDLYEDEESETPFGDSSDITTMREMVVSHIEDEMSWEDFCEENRIEPYDVEVFEHWAVSSWFKGKLAENGQITGELLDFDVWGRATSGQSISMDHVIAVIAAEMEILANQKNSWAE